MLKKILIITVFILLCLINANNVSAVTCVIDPNTGQQLGCSPGETCKPAPGNPTSGTCEKDVFGQIQPPAQLKTGPTGSGAISDFLSRLVILIYSIAAVAFIFMLLWGAFEWLTSGGDKEKIAGARHRIMNAIIGIILFAVAFAIIRVIGTFTGFSLFNNQNIPPDCIRQGNTFICPP